MSETLRPLLSTSRSRQTGPGRVAFEVERIEITPDGAEVVEVTNVPGLLIDQAGDDRLLLDFERASGDASVQPVVRRTGVDASGAVVIRDSEPVPNGMAHAAHGIATFIPDAEGSREAVVIARQRPGALARGSLVVAGRTTSFRPDVASRPGLIALNWDGEVFPVDLSVPSSPELLPALDVAPVSGRSTRRGTSVVHRSARLMPGRRRSLRCASGGVRRLHGTRRSRHSPEGDRRAIWTLLLGGVAQGR